MSYITILMEELSFARQEIDKQLKARDKGKLKIALKYHKDLCRYGRKKG